MNDHQKANRRESGVLSKPNQPPDRAGNDPPSAEHPAGDGLPGEDFDDEPYDDEHFEPL